jgi:MoxR-like ATPase
MIHDARLHVLNCHATTETSDLLGNLRPVRGRQALENALYDDVMKLKKISAALTDSGRVPGPGSSLDAGTTTKSASSLFAEAKYLLSSFGEDAINSTHDRKRQKVSSGGASPTQQNIENELFAELNTVYDTILQNYQKLQSIFEWSDGPLVEAMKRGDTFLLDEISLAEDAVIERLNSVLEPSRSLVLAEKTTSDSEDSRVIIADESFQLFATMNPGGDFGKRELSPALRSRFTEIWVTPISESSDVDMVLQRLLLAEGIREPTFTPLKKNMMEYFEWFNSICSDPANPREELSLSVRDIVAWTKFVSESTKKNQSIKIWEAYLHGAYLMHLDGLGLGTVLAENDVKLFKHKAEAYLKGQVEESNGDQHAVGFELLSFQRQQDRFGFDPFWIPSGPRPVETVEFDFNAPTTARNLARILRAMQLPKPILLEGSPGVGKTTLVAALAEAAGHKLVRINLSEQTDMSDLIGSDLPSDDTTSNSTAAFRWFDGTLLAAIKSGHWVLLDELNLASQSVLEGLNSCLDHRASVYIPELGYTVDCPATFRVFAAQNPLSQGGGRKGLPRSFLNRFTKVYVDALSEQDMISIAAKSFPSIPRHMSEKIVSFNSTIDCEVTEGITVGQRGGPWEFNLRDIFRLCALVRDSQDAGANDAHRRFKSYVQDLYLKRFRTWEDRRSIADMYLSEWSGGIDMLDTPLLKMSDAMVEVGTAKISRGTTGSRAQFTHEKSLSAHPFSLRGVMEAVARCVENKWPCLLVLNSSAVGISTLHTLGELAGVQICEIALTPSSDVSELIGSFEQVGCLDHLRRQIDRSINIICGLVMKSYDVGHLLVKLQKLLATSDDESLFQVVRLASDALDEAQTLIGAEGTSLDEMNDVRQNLRLSLESKEEKGNIFVWKDGVLVEAMLRGDWVHLRNANLCPASVLDRLNSVLEPNGYLMLAECGTDECSGIAGRIVNPHPNFRIFLTMDPEYGEISRAMRNRCVEIAVLPNPDTDSALYALDQMSRLWKLGIRSTALAIALSENQNEWADYPKAFPSQSFSCAIGFGCRLSFCSEAFARLHNMPPNTPGMLTTDTMEPNAVLPMCPYNGIASSENPALICALARARALQTFYPGMGSMPSVQDAVPPGVGQFKVPFVLTSADYPNMAAFIASPECEGSALRNELVVRCLADCNRLGFFEGSKTLRGTTAQSLLTIAREYRELTSSPNAADSVPESAVSHFATQKMRRIILRENRAKGDVSHRSPLLVSLLVSEGSVEQSMIVCRVTPTIYPFFVALEEWLSSFLRCNTTDSEVATKLGVVLDCYDGLWELLSLGTFSESGNELFGFPEDTFLVGWNWFKKSFRILASMQRASIRDKDLDTRLEGVTRQIDYAAFQGINPAVSGLRKLMPKPVIPRQRLAWVDFLGLKTIGAASILRLESEIDSFRPVELHHLVARHDPTLIVSANLKSDIIGALATMYAASIRDLPHFSKTGNALFVGLKRRFEDSVKEFSTSFLAIKVQSGNDDEEIPKTLEELEDIMTAARRNGSVYGDFSRSILHAFAAVQLSPCHEFICERIEAFVIREICGAIARSDAHKLTEKGGLGSKHDVEKYIRYLIDAGASKLQWRLEDLSPFQVALWAMQSPLLDHAELVGVLRAILPTLRVNLARRVWRNASHLLTTVSSRLTLPALLESTDEIEYDFDTRDLVSCDVLHRSVFNLVGSTVSPIVDSTSSACFMSIENYEPRGKQAIELANLFVLDGLTPNSPEPWEMSLMVSDILETLSKSTALPSSRDAVKIIKTDGYLDDEFQSVITRQLEAMPDVSLRALLDPTLPLLLQALGRLWRPRSNPESKCDYALVQVYAGLLRFHCYLPDSPIDPGRKPIAKMQLLNERAVRLRRRLAAVKLDSGMSNGCVNPENDETYLTLQETSAKAKNQAGKVIERVEGIPAFSGLWKELHDLSRSILDITTISGLCTSIRDKVPSFTVEMEQWQSTSAAFCAYASDKYAGYSDVIDPLVESVGTVERGLRAIAVLSSERGSIIKELSRETFQFPCGGNMQRVRNISSALSRMELEEVGPQTGRGLLNTAFSMLHQIVAYSTLSETDDERLAIFSNLLNWIMSAAEKQDFTSTIDGDVPRTDEEKEELAFRTQFPDHEKDFNIESEDDESTREDAIEQASHTDQESKLALCEEEYDSLCDVHGAIFGSESHPGKSSFDGDSLMSFRFAFSAASAFSRDGESSTLSANSYACQVLALSLSCDTVSRDTSADTNSNEFDFYHDSDPEQAKRASSALESLVSRLVGLLHVFPGNSILLKVAEVADRVRKLDMNRSPLGKIMVGLELTLKHAQDWEQHSSERTMIGEPLQALSTIVAALRRLELQSWSGLLSARERAQKSMAKKKWGDLFWLLNGYLDGIVLSSSGSDVLPRYSYLTPAWVWQHQQMMCPPEILLKKATDGLTDLVKALDSLLLASPLGEFSTRLAIVGSFATEFEILASRKAAEEVLRVARAIRSLHSYYCQFDAFISKHLSGLRLPFEKRLRDEVKLAKWDEQSYYALASSGEKSHRKLMMILREFDEALETIVSVVLEKELEKGVRPTDDTPVDTIPGPSVLFPLAGPLKGSKSVRSTRERKRRLHHPEARKLEGNDELAKLVSDTFKYVSKMDLLVDQDLGQTILSEQGHVHVDALCTSVFERIESLRNPKTTRPMKERAVVDLFKELQNQGYSGLKWRTPIEIQRFGEILLVPSVNVPLGFPDDDACSSISSANTYFLRSIAEINRMRGEAALMGQQHMTNRQVDQMLAFSSHGTLLLCQQRAVLAYTLAELGKFKENVRDLEEASRSVLPRQRDLVKAFTALRTDHTGLRENLQQTKIILQKTTRFWQQPEQLSWGRDVMACIASYLDAAPQTISGWNSLVLPDHLKTAQEIVKDGEKFLRHIRAFEEGGRQLSTLPSSVLASSIVLIEQVVNSGRACTQLISHEPRTDELSIGDCASKASELVDYCRLATQVCVKVTKEPQNTIDEEKPIWDSHVGSTTELLGVKLDRLAGTSKNLLEVLKDIHFGTATATLASSVSLLCTQLVQLLERRITEYAAFHRSAGKFQYIMLRIFRVLIAKGFCSAKITEKDGEGEGDVDGMQFEDGTGMGEGEGSRDVTDQIEDEEQLLGLKSDEKKDDDNDEPNKQLNKDEADTGMEMENDFEGDLHDLPDEDENEKSADEDDEKEELDREMGDEPDPNEEVIDKKLWDEDDEDEDGKDDGLDRGGALEGEAMEDEMITQDEKDQKEKEESREDGQKDKPNAEEPESDDDAQDEFPEDTVEENNLMNARDDRLQNEEGEEENDEEMELGEEMDLDAGDEEADNSHDDTAEESLADEASDNQDGEEDDPDDGEQESSPEEGEPTSRKADGPAETEDDDKPDDEDPPEEPLQMDSQEANAHQGLGLRSQDGKDSVIDPVGTEDPTESDDREVSQDDNGEAEGPKESDKRGSDGGSGNRGDTGTISQSATSSGKTNEEEVPNPFKSPGDVEKFWHRKLNVIQSQSQEDDAPSTNDAEEEDRVDKDGQFEHVDKGQEGTTQALVDADDHDAPEINENKGEEDAAEAPQVEQPSEKEGAIHTEERTAGQRNKNQSKDESGSQDVDAMDIDEPDHSEEKNPDEEGVTDSGADHEDKEDTGNRVVSDISQLSMEDKLGQDSRSQGIIEDGGSEMALVDRDEARSKWNRINGEVHGLSRRLCEKLRLVLEPMVATKLRGDYRTGKRINMKRVIGYIASGYRKDKIWLRRTKPSKRNYRVLVAVDDSESMANSGSGPMALKALAALSTGMSQLEIGELGVAKFGDDMQLIHPFSTPFTSESGVNLMQHFRFEQQRTRTALCVESAMLALEEPGEFAPMQLVLLISDGKIERDNRGALRRLIREMLEKNILMALIIVEGKEKKESILNLKEVAFESGRPKVRSFIEDYPFPYYIVLEDLATLPDVLGDALRQWFEMISRIDTSS